MIELDPTRTEIIYRFFSGNAASYDRVVHLFTLRADRAWKEEILELLPVHAKRVLDLACGTGILTLALARRYPEAEIIGVDIMPEYLEVARHKAEQANLRNVNFIHGRAEEVNLDGAMDCITGSYLAKYADLGLLTQKAASLLRPGGILVLHDFVYPSNPVMAWLLERYFQLLRVVGPRRFPEWGPVFDELFGFLRKSKWVEDLEAAMDQHAFLEVGIQYLGWGTAAIVRGRKSNGS